MAQSTENKLIECTALNGTVMSTPPPGSENTEEEGVEGM